MGDIIKVVSELIRLMPQFPGWLRWFHYLWILLAFGSAFTTFVWYTSSTTAPTRVREQARARQPVGVPVALQDMPLGQLKTTVGELQSQGLNLMARGEYDQAIAVYQKAQVYLNEALIQAAKDLYIQNLRGYMLKDWAQINLFLGNEDAASKLLTEAEGAFSLILKQNKNDASAHNGLGSVYVIRGDLDRAEKEIRIALKILPHYEAAQHDLKLVERLKRAKK